MGKVKNSNYSSYFPCLLRDLLDKNNIKQEDLANYVGVTRQTISLYKDGLSSPDIYVLQKIVKYFREEKGIEYSLDFWLGNEKVDSTISLNQLNLSSDSIKALMSYRNDKLLMYSLNLLITNKNFLNKLSSYLIDTNINNLIFENDKFKEYCENFHCIFPISKANSKYEFADIIEYLPLFKNLIMKKINIKDNEDLFFEYLYQLELQKEKEDKNNCLDSSLLEDFPVEEYNEYLKSNIFIDFDKKYNKFLENRKK